jgi:hypothetical protein
MKLLVEVCLLPSWFRVADAACLLPRRPHGPYKSNPRTNSVLEGMAIREASVSLNLSVAYAVDFDGGRGGEQRCQNPSL